MSQIFSADRPLDETYGRGLRSLLWRVRPRRLGRGVELVKHRSANLVDQGVARETAWQMVYERTRQQVIRRLLRIHGGSPQADWTTSRRRRFEDLAVLLEDAIPRAPQPDEPDFQCDAALGGLARWLRAAGYDARWWPGIDDDELLRKALGSSSILLTNDGRLAARGMIAKGVVPALLVPITLDKRGQFAWTATQLDLPQRPTRCMECGGRLNLVEKTSVRERIPPRTYPWLDAYYLCERCHKLYWEGTHWDRIRAELEKVQSRVR